MDSNLRAAELRALAEGYASLAGLEAEYEQAVEAYRADKSDENKEAYRAAADALVEVRRNIRQSGTMAAANEPGSATVSPAPAGSAGVN